MNSRRYIGALIIVLTFLGAVYQQQNTLQNQEIILQFTDVKVTSAKTQSTIAIVKKQLQDLGANNIQVKETKNGTLKITYYSNTDVVNIKKTLSQEKKLVLDYTANKESSKLPAKNSSIGYNLDVYEIKQGNQTDWNLVKNNVLEQKLEHDRFFNPNFFVLINTNYLNDKDLITKVAFKVRRNVTIAIDNTSHNIPEVRAGPMAILDV